MVRGIKRLLRRAAERVNRQIETDARSGGLYAKGTASEGFNGGYAAALEDVTLALNGSIPERHGWWCDECPTQPQPPKGKE